MKTKMKLIFISAIMFFAFGCSKNETEEETPKIKFADTTLLGTWEGNVVQDGYLPVFTKLTIDKLDKDKKAGDFEGVECKVNFVYLGKVGDIFTFSEDLLPGSTNPDCIGGTSLIEIKTKDKLEYFWTCDDFTQNTAKATFVRK